MVTTPKQLTLSEALKYVPYWSKWKRVPGFPSLSYQVHTKVEPAPSQERSIVGEDGKLHLNEACVYQEVTVVDLRQIRKDKQRYTKSTYRVGDDWVDQRFATLEEALAAYKAGEIKWGRWLARPGTAYKINKAKYWSRDTSYVLLHIVRRVMEVRKLDLDQAQRFACWVWENKTNGRGGFSNHHPIDEFAWYGEICTNCGCMFICSCDDRTDWTLDERMVRALRRGGAWESFPNRFDELYRE